MELARNHELDGIHLEFVRYPVSDWGYSPASLGLYEVESGTSTPRDPGDAQWQAWRRARVTAFVRDLHDDLQLRRPSVKLSGALSCYGGGPLSASGRVATAACTPAFQDWRAWVGKGYIAFRLPLDVA